MQENDFRLSTRVRPISSDLRALIRVHYVAVVIRTSVPEPVKDGGDGRLLSLALSEDRSCNATHVRFRETLFVTCYL